MYNGEFNILKSLDLNSPFSINYASPPIFKEKRVIKAAHPPAIITLKARPFPDRYAYGAKT